MPHDDDLAAKINALVRHAAEAVEDDPVRPALIAAVNTRLGEPGRFPRSLYAPAGRARLCGALNQAAERRGWRPVAPDELREAPRGGFAEPGPGRERPDPWGWFPARDVAPVRCGEATHKIVWEAGRITTPDHPGAEEGTRCGDIRVGRRVPRRFEEHRQRAYVVGYDHAFFTDAGIADLRIDNSYGEHWFFAASMFFDFGDDLARRYEQRLPWWDEDDGEYTGPIRGPVHIHDPARPELTGVAVRSRRDRKGWRSVEVGLWLSAWWQLEVLGTPWERIEDLRTLDVLEWDLERREPIRVLLLDWHDDPLCPGIAMRDRGERWTSHDWDNVWPLLVEAEIARADGAWNILDRQHRPAPVLPDQQSP